MNYLISALIITLIIPIWGLLIYFLNKLLYILLSKISSEKVAMTVVNYLTIPGVIHHELSHAALALLTGAIVTEFKPFWPDKTSGSLGHVNFSTRGSLFTRCLQCTFTSTAPVILGTLSSILLFAYAANNTVPFYILVPMIYLIFSIIIHASMSFADVKIMLKGIWALFIAAYIICLYFQIDFLNVIRLHLIAQL